MAIQAPTIHRLTPVIGAQLLGIDLRHPDNAVFHQVHDALLKYQVVFFRDQEISLDAQKALGSFFGPLVSHPNEPGVDGHPEVLPIHADANSVRVQGERWHSDVSCDREPPLGSILRIYRLPETGGDTLFASMYAAYDALSDKMKTLLDGLKAVHDGGPYYRDINERRGRIETVRTYPRAEHPVVRTHPETGRKAIFVNESFTTRIVGLPKDEGDAILRFLYAHIQRPEFQCRFTWQKNSIAFWDNRCVQHLAVWDYYPETRSGYRVTIKGDRPA